MAMRFLRTASVFAALAVPAVLPGVAGAQTLPTAPQVGDALDIGCATTPNGGLINEAACLQAILDAVGVARQYSVIGGNPVLTVPPQVDIGYYLCRLGIRVPRVFDDIIEAIEAADNIHLRSGCRDAVEQVNPPLERVNPPPPRISPA